MDAVTQAVQETFDNWARQGRGDAMAKGHWPTASQILAQLHLQPGDWFLDVGCGNGYAVGWAAQQVGPLGKAIGVDLSPEMMTQAKAQFQQTNTVFQVTDAQHLPFAENTFDRIISIESLYYYPDIPAVLAELRRMLKPGGWFAAMADYYQENPYSACWGELLPIPVTSLSEGEYRHVFEAAGFIAVRTERLFNAEPVDPATFTPGWGYHTAADKQAFRQQIGSLAIWGQKPV